MKNSNDRSCAEHGLQGSWEACIDGLYAAVGDEAALSAALDALLPFVGAQRVPLLGNSALVRPTALQVAAGPFGPQVEAHMAALLLELERVLKLHRRVAPTLSLGQSLARLYQQMALPMGFIDAAGQLRDANPAAVAVLDEASLLRRGPNDHLQFHAEHGWQPLGLLQAQLAEQAGVEALLSVQHGPATLLCLRRASPWQLEDGADQGPAAAVFALRGLDLRLDGFMIQRRFDLTARELEIAQGLGDGLAAQALADRFGLRLTTVRTHIAALIQKTSSSRQAELLFRLRGRS